MTEKDVFLMSGIDRKRLKVISMAVDRRIKQWEAAEKLDISERQTRRLINRYRNEGDKGLVHRLRGRPSARRISGSIREEVVDIYVEKYKGFGPTLAREKFVEKEGIEISRESLRKQLLEAGLWEISRKSKKHRHWRERMKYRGEMVQMDGSHHDWLEGRGPWLVMMGYIDDATGVVYAEFHDYEGTKPAMISFKGYARKHGMPLKIYLDKHTTYKSTKEETIEDQLKGIKAKSQFERALNQLGVEVIHANSPQAKGRIERLFRTFQDRLVKEMRLANICNKDEANAFLRGYLPEFNVKFAVEPASEQDMHREIVSWKEMNNIMTIRTERTVRNDYTIAHEGKMYQLKTVLPLKGRNVTFVELLNDRFRIEHKGQKINWANIKPRPKVKVQERKRLYKPFFRPAKNHPWKAGFDNSMVI
jgi:transposase